MSSWITCPAQQVCVDVSALVCVCLRILPAGVRGSPFSVLIFSNRTVWFVFTLCVCVCVYVCVCMCYHPTDQSADSWAQPYLGNFDGARWLTNFFERYSVDLITKP